MDAERDLEVVECACRCGCTVELLGYPGDLCDRCDRHLESLQEGLD